MTLGPCPTVEPDPMTVEGTRALVERFYSLKGTEVWVGGVRGAGSLSPLALLGRKNQKRACEACSGISGTHTVDHVGYYGPMK